MMRFGGILLSALLLAGCNTNMGQSASRPVTQMEPPPNPTFDRQMAALDTAARLTRDPVARARILLQQANSMATAKYNTRALVNYDDLLGTTDDMSGPDMRRIRATAYLNRGTVLRAMHRDSDAEASFAEVVQRYSGDGDPAIRRHVASAITFQGAAAYSAKRYDDVVRIVDKADLSLCATADDQIARHCAQCLRLRGNSLNQLNRTEDALAAYSSITLRYGGRTAAIIRNEVRLGEFSRGSVLKNMRGRDAEAVAAFDAAIAIPAGPVESEARRVLAAAYYTRSLVLDRMGRPADAAAGLDQLIGDYGTDVDDMTVFYVAASMDSKANTLRGQRRLAESLAYFERAINHVGLRQGPLFNSVRATSDFGRGVVLLQQLRSDEAVAAFDAVVARFETTKQETLRETAVAAASAKALALKLAQSRQQVQDLVAEFDAKIRAEDQTDEPLRSERKAALLLLKGTTLGAVGMLTEARSAFDHLIGLYRSDSSAKLRYMAAAAMYGKGLAEQISGNRFDAARSMHDVVATYGKDSDAKVHDYAVKAERWLETNSDAEPVG